MKVFIWSCIEEATSNYHSGGGIVVFAATEERAREMAIEQGCKVKATEKPDDVRESDGDEKVYVMPDAGCC